MTQKINIKVAYTNYITFYGIYYTIFNDRVTSVDNDTGKTSGFIKHLLRNKIKATNDY